MKRLLIFWISVLVLIVTVVVLYAFENRGVIGNVVDETSFEESEDCSDSDEGVFSFQKGKVVTTKNFLGISRTYADRCVDLDGGDAVREYYCDSGRAKWVKIACDEGCGEGACAEKQPECLELIPEQNKLDDKRIDFVFVGFNYSSREAFLSIAKRIISDEKIGFLNLEPFKSNKDRFNFWYVDKVAYLQDIRKDSAGVRFDSSAFPIFDVCTKKLGYYKDTLSSFPFFSSRMFSVFLVNKVPGGSTFGGNNQGDLERLRGEEIKDYLAGLHGVYLPVPEEGKPFYLPGLGDVSVTDPTWGRTYPEKLRTLAHELGHALTQSIGFTLNDGSKEYHYESPIDNSIVKTKDWVTIGEEYGGDSSYNSLVPRIKTNCYVASPEVAGDSVKALEECRSSKNTLFGDLIGNGCGKEGVIDCCTNDPSKIAQSARSCVSCPNCYEDPKYDLEVSCYSVCWGSSSSFYRATFNSIMRTPDPGLFSYGLSNQRILSDTIKRLTGRANSPPPYSVHSICGNEIKEEGEECDLGKANGVCPSRCNLCTINDCSSYAPVRTQAGVIKPGEILSAGTTSARIAWIVSYGYSVQNNAPSVTCRYSTIAGTSYDQMTGELQVISGWRFADVPVENGKSYTYYIRCRDALGNTNEDDLALQFSVASAT